MNRADAYAALCRELEAWRHVPREQLLALVGQPASSKTMMLGQEPVSLCVRVLWEDRKTQSLRIEATADGPSCWRLERLEESVVVTPETSEPGSQPRL